MKIIFLDIDGTMNSTRTAIAYKGMLPKHDTKRIRKDGKRMVMIDPKLDPVSIGMLRVLVQDTGAKIVISSTWRRFFTETAFINAFAKYYGWKKAPIIGITPRLNMSSIPRGPEIEAWLEDHPEVTHYVILDDDSDMTKKQKKSHFIKVDNRNGFSFENFLKAREILGYVEPPKEANPHGLPIVCIP